MDRIRNLSHVPSVFLHLGKLIPKAMEPTGSQGGVEAAIKNREREATAGGKRKEIPLLCYWLFPPLTGPPIIFTVIHIDIFLYADILFLHFDNVYVRIGW